MSWKPYAIGSMPPRDGTWFLARSDTKGWEHPPRRVHFYDPSDRLPIAHDGVCWNSEPTHWRTPDDEDVR